MSTQTKLRSRFTVKFLKNQPGAPQDDAKRVLIFSQVIARIINLWPCDSGVSKTIFFGFMLATGILQELSLIVHLLTTTITVDVLIKAIASMMIIMQSMVKGCVFYYKSRQLKEVIGTIWNDFWPSDIMGETVRNDIKRNSKTLLWVFAIQYVSAISFLFFYVILPITKPGRHLPHTTWFPFDATASPAYEIVYIWQAYLTAYINENIVCAYDTLFCSICGNCVSQFRLLCGAVARIGSGEEGEITRKLLKISGVDYRPVFSKEDEEERKLLVICIKHHQKLIDIANRLNEIFGPGHLAQLFASVLGTCTACYRITTETSLEDLIFLGAFYVAHVSQLFEYCALSHELSYWSTSLSDSAFQSRWDTKKYTDIRKCLSIVILRSQNEISMTALGLFQLNYASFMAIMRFTFSLYTFLSNMGQ